MAQKVDVTLLPAIVAAMGGGVGQLLIAQFSIIDFEVAACSDARLHTYLTALRFAWFLILIFIGFGIIWILRRYAFITNVVLRILQAAEICMSILVLTFNIVLVIFEKQTLSFRFWVIASGILFMTSQVYGPRIVVKLAMFAEQKMMQKKISNHVDIEPVITSKENNPAQPSLNHVSINV